MKANFLWWLKLLISTIKKHGCQAADVGLVEALFAL
jgi:hypothetical protein